MPSPSLPVRCLPRQKWNATFPKFAITFLSLVLSARSEPIRSFGRSHFPLENPLAFAAGGGGFGSKPTKTAKKNKRKRDISDLISKPPPVPKEDKSDSPILDRFGLPIPTENDINPPLPPGTEIIPSLKEDGATSVEEMREALEGYLDVDLSSLGDGKREGGMDIRLLHKSPPVITIDNFFTPAECEEIMELANGDDRDGNSPMRVNSATFSPLALSKRTSTTWYCHYQQVPTLLARVKRLLNVRLECLEEPQVVRYRNGEEFSWHHDEIPSSLTSNGGQRIGTFLVYLNTLSPGCGGATEFRDLKLPSGEPLKVTPKRGKALLFFPASRDGTADDRTLHKGEVVTIEEESQEAKMITQIWIHQRDYEPAVPEGNCHADAMEAVKEKEEEFGFL